MAIEVGSRFMKRRACTIELRHRRPDFLDAWPGIDEGCIGSSPSEISFASQENRELSRVVEDSDHGTFFDDVTSSKANLAKLTADTEAEVAIIVFDDPLIALWHRPLPIAAAGHQDHDGGHQQTSADRCRHDPAKGSSSRLFGEATAPAGSSTSLQWVGTLV
jgi:hypothetical protein